MLLWEHISVHSQISATFSGTVMPLYDPVNAKFVVWKSAEGSAMVAPLAP